MKTQNNTNSPPIDNQKADLKTLLEQNSILREEIGQLTKKVNKYILLVQIGGMIRLILILAPIIIALIYLPPLIKNFIGMYQNVLPLGGF